MTEFDPESQDIVRGDGEFSEPVDLVIYLDGERKVIGRAGINGDGKVIAEINPELEPEIAKIVGTVRGEFSFGLPRASYSARIPYTAGPLPADDDKALSGKRVIFPVDSPEERHERTGVPVSSRGSRPSPANMEEAGCQSWRLARKNGHSQSSPTSFHRSTIPRSVQRTKLEGVIMRSLKRYGAAAVALVAALICLPLAFTTSALADAYTNSHSIHVVAVSTHSVEVGWSAVGATVKDEVIVYNPSTLQLVKHFPSEAGHNVDRTVDFGSEAFAGEALAAKVAFVVNGHNTGWSLPVTFYTNVASGASGAKGDTGATGPAGPQGPAGPSGVVSTGVHSLVSANTTINTGGSFTAQEQLAGSLDLTAGTYQVTINAKVAWKSGNGVFPQFFVYNGTPVSDFSNNLFNVGNGGLAQGNATIDSYYGGTDEITVAGPETLNVYAFGYDEDHGAGSYTLENLSLTATKLLVAA